MTISISASGIALDGPLVAGEKVAVSVSGLALAAEDKPTLALLARFPDALLASVELTESDTPGTWTGELDTATKQTALFFATARADERRDAALELVAGRASLARLTVPMANSALCPKPDGSPFASPVYVPVPGPPGQGGDPYDQAPEMDGEAAAGTSDEYARGDHRHPTDTSRASAADVTAIQNVIPSTATPTNKLATAADIPAAQVNADWEAESGVAQILHKPSAMTPTEHAGTHHSVDGSDPLDGTVLNVGGSGSYSGTSIATAIDDLNTTVAGKADASSLADVATTGDYGDLLNKPTIPAAQVNADWNAASGVAQILNKPTIPDVSGKADATAIAPAFSSSSTYAVGDYVTYEGLLYKCTTAVSTAGAWTAANWTAVAVTDEMGADTPLPFDAECEYVTVPVGAYILPEVQTISPEVNLYSQIKISSPPSASAGFFIGNWSGAATGSTQIVFNAASTCAVINGNNATTVSSSGVVGQLGVVALQGNKITIGATTSSSAPNVAARAPLDIGVGACVLATGEVDASTITGVQTDIASFVIRSGGAATRDFVPVRIGTVGYLYDKVSGRLFGSAVGSIPLVPGPDKATPTITTPGRIVELTPAIRYSFASPTPSVSGTSATVACEDRAINDFTVATGITSLTITPPAAVTGRARDFFCRVTLTDASLPTVTLSGATIDIGAAEVAGMTQGVNLLMFTEISSGHWLASRRSAS